MILSLILTAVAVIALVAAWHLAQRWDLLDDGYHRSPGWKNDRRSLLDEAGE